MAATRATNSASQTLDHAERPAPAILKLIDLAPHGDIILIAGAPPTTRVKVSAQQLTQLSPVFERMLSGRFAEGQVDRSARAPQEIRLPGDDVQGVSDMCHLLYHQIDDLDDPELPTERLFQLIQIADKYNCLNKLRLQLITLLQRQLDGLGRVDHEKWEMSAMCAGAAYLLDDANLFEATTLRLTTHYYEPLSSLRKLLGGDLLPPAALLAMAEKRVKAQRLIYSELKDENFHSDHDDDSYQHNQARHRDVLDEFDVWDNWPPTFEQGTKSLRNWMEHMGELHSIGKDHSCRLYNCENVCITIDLFGMAADLERICEGLCLRCVREDSVDVGEDTCVHKPKRVRAWFSPYRFESSSEGS